MIKINLLSSFNASSGAAAGGVIASDEDEKKRILTEVGKRVVVLIIAPLGLYLYEGQNIPNLQSELSDANQKYAELKQFNDSKQGLAQEIKKFEEEQSRFNAQMDFINKISSDKVNEYKLFLHLKESTPASVWVNRLELNDNILSILVESDDAKEIDKFIQRLSNADFITNLVPLKQTITKDFAGVGIPTTQFTVRAQLHTVVTQ